MTLQGGACETSESEVDYSCIHPWRDHDVRCLQEKAGAPTASTATAAAVTHSIDFSKPEQR
jgi:hypothetical protein